MSPSDVFALKNSGLNEFLFAEVGNEMNGSPLTILSVLARLGKDPWTEAARLARLPRSSIIDDLAHNISMMPLCSQALADARRTAARLILLLPSQVQSISARATLPVGKSTVPTWIILAALLAMVVGGIAFQMIAPGASTGTLAPFAGQTISHPQAATN